MYTELRKKISTITKKLNKLFGKQPRLKFIYAWYYKHASVNEKQVLFESFHGKEISDSPYYILMEFLKMPESGSFKIYFSTNDYKRHKQFIDSIGLKIRLVDISTIKYVKVLATSRYLINNSSFPAYFIRRNEQTYLQTWHGTPLKTLGKKMRFGIESMYNVQHNFLQANYIMFPNDFTRDVIMEDYNLNSLYTGNVVMNGYPRNSIFCDRAKGEENCLKLHNKQYTTLAYMPTWRGQSNHDIQTIEYDKEINHMLKYLDGHLLENQKLYVNFHPIVQSLVHLDNYEHIFPFPQDMDKYGFLNSIDALITDYSSVFFDFSVTGKPIILFLYDYEQYMHDRGMYFDVRELPFRKIYTIEDLKECIVTEDFRRDSYKDNHEYVQKFLAYDVPDSGKRIAELIFHHQSGDLPIVDYSVNRERERRVVFLPDMKSPVAIDTLVKLVDPEKDIVIFEKRFFNPSLSSYLYDHYAESFDHIFITKTLPRTYLEEFLSERNDRIKDRLHVREIRRCFADLNINPVFCEEYYNGYIGGTFFLKKAPTLDVKVSVVNGSLLIDYHNTERNDITKLVIAHRTRKIIWLRELSEEEKSKGIIKEDFTDFLDGQKVELNGRYLLALETYNSKTKTKGLFYLLDMEKYRNGTYRDEMDQSALYWPSLFYKNIILRNGLEYEELSILPYIAEKSESIEIFVRRPNKIMGVYICAQVLKLRVKGSVISVKLRIKKQETPIKNVVFAYRSTMEHIRYGMDYRILEKSGDWIVDARIDLTGVKLQSLYWDMFVLMDNQGHEDEISLRLSRAQFHKLRIGNYYCFADAERSHIVFPYCTKGGNLAFVYRAISKYDGYDVAIKELAAYVLFMVLHPYWKRRRMWLVYEKFCAMAQDNGYYFFQYCMEELPEKEKKHIYYVIDRESADWGKVKRFGNQVIPFMSFRHMLFCLVAKIYIGSDTKSHLYAWRTKPNVIFDKIKMHKIFFLQHGVTALKRVDTIFGKKAVNPMNYFTTTSEFEQKIVVNYFGYKEEEAPVLGFARWDVLEDTSMPDERMILIMPTWRSWLEEKDNSVFKDSDYYKNYQALLQNERLGELLEANNISAIFYIHPKFKDYLEEFNMDRGHIRMIPFGEEPLNEIMKRCAMLITDYSSVCWDVYYMEKPVLFYQFDYDTYMKAHGSYLNMETDLFGDRYLELDQLIDGIGEYINRDFVEKEQYAQMRDQYFAFRDSRNSMRTYQYIVDQGY